MELPKTRFCCLLILTVAHCSSSARADEGATDPLAVFEQRIMPIFASPKPSSCVQCHLASVDLKDYIRPTSKATFQSLRQNGLIDAQHPPQSKILQLIAMGERDPDPTAIKIHAKLRQAEHEAFAAWIEACCRDKELMSVTEPAQSLIGPALPLEIVRHNRKDRLLDSFVRNIWSQRMRCFPCHTPGEIDSNNPQHAQPAERHAEFVEKYGQKMNIFRETPEETLRIWLATAHKSTEKHLPLINLETPEHSLLLLKPTAKLPPKAADGSLGTPSSALPVSHMGGLKMRVNDGTYKAFLSWIEDYSNVTKNLYAEAKQLPPDNWYPSEQVLRIKAAPEDWPNLATLQVFVYAWDADENKWKPEPAAFTQALVAPNRMVNGNLFLIANQAQKAQWQAEPQELAAGKYLLRVAVDHAEALLENPTRLLDVGPESPQVEVEASWQKGFKNAEIIEGSAFK